MSEQENEKTALGTDAPATEKDEAAVEGANTTADGEKPAGGVDGGAGTVQPVTADSSGLENIFISNEATNPIDNIWVWEDEGDMIAVRDDYYPDGVCGVGNTIDEAILALQNAEEPDGNIKDDEKIESALVVGLGHLDAEGRKGDLLRIINKVNDLITAVEFLASLSDQD